MVPFTEARNDDAGRPSAVLKPSDCRHVYALAAGAPVLVTLPRGTRTILFSANTDLWVQYGGPVTLPSATDTSGAAPELNPGARAVSVSLIGIVSDRDGLANLAFYR